MRKDKVHRLLLIDFLSKTELNSDLIYKFECMPDNEKIELVDLVFREGLQGVFYDLLPSNIFPKKVYRGLKKEYYQTIAKWFVLKSAFLPVADVMEQEGIKFLVVKGFVYSHYLYSSPGLRPIKDIDILIHRGDALKVDAIFRKFGFKHAFNDEMNYYRYDAVRVAIDVHTELMFPPADDLWGGAMAVKLDEHLMFTPNLELQMVYLISHPLIQHGYIKLIWLYEFLLFLRKHSDEIDPDHFRSLTRDYGLEIPFSIFFDFCKSHFLESFPEIKRFFIEHPTTGRSFIVSFIFKKCVYANRHFEMGYIFYFILLPGFKKKYEFLVKFLFPDDKFLKKRHSPIPCKLGRRVSRPFLMLIKGICKTFQWLVS